MSFDSASRTIIVNLEEVNETASYSLEVKLVDSTNRESTYT